jgi:hypothetical protein
MDSYRQQYPWKPETKNCKLKQLVLKTFNGETELFLSEKFIKRRINRGIPKFADIFFSDLKDTLYWAEIFFNEEKTIATFENFFKKVSNENTVMELIYNVKPRTLNRPKALRTFDIYLKNSDSIIKLETDKVNLWLKE